MLPLFPVLGLLLLLLLPAGDARSTLFPYSLVDADGVPTGRCATGDGVTGSVWPAGAGQCHDDAQVPCVADPPADAATAGLHESIMCSHIPDSTADSYPLGLCDMSASDPAASCTTATATAVCGSGGSCSAGGCAFIGGVARCSLACLPFQGPDVDCDGTLNAEDACPWYPSTTEAATESPAPASQDPRAQACLCGDQNGDGRLDVLDIIAVNLAIFSPALAHPLCDANKDYGCTVSDVVSVNAGIFRPGTTVCNRHPQPLP